MQNTIFAVLANREPWRQRIGFPNTVDDPLFIPQDHIECDGEIEYEGRTKYWRCTKCGYIGWATLTKHYPSMNPRTFYKWCRNYFTATRNEDSDMTEDEVLDQMFFVMAVALKQASKRRPEEMREFVARLAEL